MEEKPKKTKKQKVKNILIYGGITLLILFVVITCIVINWQKNRLDDINDANNNLPGQEIVKIL